MVLVWNRRNSKRTVAAAHGCLHLVAPVFPPALRWRPRSFSPVYRLADDRRYCWPSMVLLDVSLICGGLDRSERWQVVLCTKWQVEESSLERWKARAQSSVPGASQVSAYWILLIQSHRRQLSRV